MHPATQAVLQHFQFDHLPAHLQAVSRPCAELAHQVAESIQDDPEVTIGLRKLLEAKDCFVRAAVTAHNRRLTSPQYFDFTKTGLFTEKLQTPLGPGAYPTNEGGVGSVGWVSLWNGHPDEGGLFLEAWALDGDRADGCTEAPTGAWPATHVRGTVYPDITGSILPTHARLRVNGSPYKPGFDSSIKVEGSCSLRPDPALAEAVIRIVEDKFRDEPGAWS